MPESQYKMSISLNVLNHLGLNLYSNTPAVLSEVIANAWDADASEVRVTFDLDDKTITVADNGCGMDRRDINEKFLHVGYQKRGTKAGRSTPGGRKPMGRKGIGKLSLFSIADKISVYSLKRQSPREAFLMDANEIKKHIEGEGPSAQGMYEPRALPWDEGVKTSGTVIKISDLRKLRLTKTAVKGLKKRIARRFGIIGQDGFKVYVNDEEVSFTDRDYFHKARFLFQYGNQDYSKYCTKLSLDEETEEPMCFKRGHIFGENGKYAISGWIAIAHHSNDLDEAGHGQPDDNLNKITIVVRGKVAQEDILQEYRLGGLITKFMYGEINADFLDEDGEEDIATSSRQRITEDDPRYRELKDFIGKELREIRWKTSTLKEKKALDAALSFNPGIKEWYDGLNSKWLQDAAKKIFGDIEKMEIDDKHKKNLYINGILAFERLKMSHALEALKNIDLTQSEELINIFSGFDAIEAEVYREVVRERMRVIKTLRDQVHGDVKEKILEEYIFKHLWLLDPAWERATQYAEMERTVWVAMNAVRKKERDEDKDKYYRLDIQYRRVMGGHVIVELKRASRRLNKTDIEQQLRKYISAVHDELVSMNDKSPQINSICIVGEWPRGWDNPETRKQDEDSLLPYSIRVMTYKEMINNAFTAYSKYIEASETVEDLRKTIAKIEKYEPKQDDDQRVASQVS